jgi:hypothetical protein
MSEVIDMDFAAKDKGREMSSMEKDAQVSLALEILDESLTAARAYELAGDGYDICRAYCLDRGARALQAASGSSHSRNSLHILYADMKQTAGELFRDASTEEEPHYYDAGFSFLRAAIACVSARDAERAKKLIGMSDGCFDDSVPEKAILGRANLLDIFTKEIFRKFDFGSRTPEILLFYAENREKAAGLFLKSGETEEAGYSFLRSAEAYALLGDCEKAEGLLAKSDKAFVARSIFSDEIRARVIAIIDRKAEGP